MKHAEEIKDYLQDQGINILEQKEVLNWESLSLYLYFSERGGNVAQRIARNQAYCELETPNKALYLQIEKGVPEEKLKRIKKEIREWFGEETGIYDYNGERSYININCMHVPDYKDLKWECQVIDHFFKND
jgi:hypothetical protein